MTKDPFVPSYPPNRVPSTVFLSSYTSHHISLHFLDRPHGDRTDSEISCLDLSTRQNVSFSGVVHPAQWLTPDLDVVVVVLNAQQKYEWRHKLKGGHGRKEC